MSSERNQRPWSSGYPGSNYRDTNQRNRFRQTQSSEYQRSNSSHSGYQDRHRQSEYAPSVYNSRRNTEESPGHSHHYRRDHHGSTVRNFSFFPNNNEERLNRNYYHSQQRNFVSANEEHFRTGSSYSGGDSRFLSNRSNSQGYGSQRFHYNDSSYSDRYPKQFDYYGKKRSGDDHINPRNGGRVHPSYNINRSSIQSGSQDEDFYESRRGNDHIRSNRNTSENNALRSRQSIRPSLIPKDFKHEDDEDEDEDIMKELKERYKSRDASVNSDQISSETNNISETTPTNVEHKEELDIELDSESREVSEEPLREINLEDNTRNIDEDDGKVETDMTGPLQISASTKTDEIFTEINESPREKSPSEFSESSDSYDPEREAEEVLSSHELVEPAKDEHTLEGLKTPNDVELERIKVEDQIDSKPVIIVPLEDIEYSMFPLPRVELSAWEYKNYPKSEVLKHSPYLLKTPITDFRAYPFYERNYLVHEQLIKRKLQGNLYKLKQRTLFHKRDLLNEYSHRLNDWKERLDVISKQQDKIYESMPDQVIEEVETIPPTISQDKPRTSASRRGGRYNGDAVHSEAEFLEILKNLEKEKEDDPLYRAEQLAAKIPDMLLNPIHKSLKFTNINNLVLKKENWANRIKTDAIDTFTKHEHELFCEAFLAYPKRFGRISQYMGDLRTAQECVLHYYKTKKSLTDYKQLLALKKKKNRKGASKGKRGVKSKTGTSTPSTTADVSAPDTSGDELNLENFIPREVNEEVIYTETGRRKRAAAPTFDSKDKKEDQVNSDERKRSVENLNETKDAEIATQQPIKVKKQRGPKPRKHLEIADGSQGEIIPDGAKNKSLITSYWSVRDINLLAELLNKFGAKWDIIADGLKTKSAVMVKNYYHRNADRYGWTRVTETDNEASSVLTQTGLQRNEAQVKNPPLGFFNAQANVPSNIAFGSNETTVKSETSLLPAAVSRNSIDHPVSSNDSPFLPQLSTFVNSREILPERSNPFSISNLLNPSEERKVIASVLPVAGTFDRVEEKRELYSAYKGANTSSGHAIEDLLSNSNTGVSKSMDAGFISAPQNVRPITTLMHNNDVLKQAASPSYQLPFFDVSNASRSILNGDKRLDSLLSTTSQIVHPSIGTSTILPSVNSSNLRNILANDTLDQSKQPKST